MKKSYLLILIAIILVSCNSPSTNREAASGTNANRSAETKASAALTEADATAKEKDIWQTLTKQDLNAFAATLADDQIYVNSEGVHDKDATVKSVTGFVPTDVAFSSWKFVPINKDVALVKIGRAHV